MSYFADGNIFPTGWSATSDDKAYPRLETRLPVVALATPSSWSHDAASDNDSSADTDPPANSEANFSRIADDSSSEELPNTIAKVSSLPFARQPLSACETKTNALLACADK